MLPSAQTEVGDAASLSPSSRSRGREKYAPISWRQPSRLADGYFICQRNFMQRRMGWPQCQSSSGVPRHLLSSWPQPRQRKPVCGNYPTQCLSRSIRLALHLGTAKERRRRGVVNLTTIGPYFAEIMDRASPRDTLNARLWLNDYRSMQIHDGNSNQL